MKKIVLLALLSCSQITLLKAQLTVNPGINAFQLANAVAGTGVIVTNATVNSVPANSRGTFTCNGTCNIGLPSGIILTSGSATLAGQPNTGTGQGYDNNAAGDASLNVLTTGGTLDACVLEFDFVVASDSLVFNYVFASEEYSDYVNLQFNDVFGFFVSGPGITGQQNVAVVPGTAMPIAINNVNNGYAAAGVPPSGPCTNCSYYRDNTLNNYTIAYDGMTTVMQVKIPVMPCTTYHIKMAVADVFDRVFDSAVLIEGNSFNSSGAPCISVNGQEHCSDTLHICQGDSITLTAPSGAYYNWNGGPDTTQSITISQAGAYACIITNPANPGCFSWTPYLTIVIDSIIPSPVITQVTDTLFSSITSPNYSYSWSLNGTTITGANSPQLIISQNGCYVLTIDSNACPASSDSLCVINLGLHANDIHKNVLLVPNPFTDEAVLMFDNTAGEKFELIISDATGRLLRQISGITSSSVKMERANLGCGIYFYELKNKNGIYAKGKFIIK